MLTTYGDFIFTINDTAKRKDKLCITYTMI